MKMENRMIKSALCGFLQGTCWDECGKNRISRIYISMNQGRDLVSIQFGHVDDEGNSILLSDRYGDEGVNFKVVMLNYPVEYLTSVAGTLNFKRINSITFCSNQGKHGPFGVINPYDTTFEMEMGTDFYGFHGYSNAQNLCAIGVYIKPNANLPRVSALNKGGTNRMIKSNPPCGTCTGISWDECGKHCVSRIFVSMDANHNLNSLQFGYVDEGNSVTLSDRYGDKGPNLRVVMLNYPSEYLTGVNGTFNAGRISSITFTTNQGKYGPFGVQNPHDKTFDMEMGLDFYGFHGYSNAKTLSALGVYIKPNVNLSED